MGRKFDYPAKVKTDKGKKKFREEEVCKYPEELFTNYVQEGSTEEDNHMFSTNSIDFWVETVCSHYTNNEKTVVKGGHRLDIYEDGRPKTGKAPLIIHLYTKGTVLVQGNKVNMETFEKDFPSFKAAVDQKRNTVTTTSSSSAPQTPHSSDNQLNESMAQLNLNTNAREQSQDGNGKPKWQPISVSRREQLKKLHDSNLTIVLKNIHFVTNIEFLIGKGSDGTEVFLGLRDDGTEVAVKRMTKTNFEVLKHEELFIRLPELDHASIVRYVDSDEDKNFGYLFLQLCEYNLEEYLTKYDGDALRKTHVKQILKSLKALHCHHRPILHRDLKPQNVLIDVTRRARLADFGISRQLIEGQTTHQTGSAGTTCWRAKETLAGGGVIPYKRSTDIQVAGMLIYYILSGGLHPFGDKSYQCENNIHEGIYTLDHVQDLVAKDLIEWMIKEEPKDRPTVEQCLSHPLFWKTERRVEYLRRTGNREEVKNCRNATQQLIDSLEKYDAKGSFKEWKKKFPSEVVKNAEDKKKAYPENTLGLVRFIRILHEHYAKDLAEMIEMTKMSLTEMFPDLFECVYTFANSKGWNGETPLKEMFGTRFSGKQLKVPVQDSETLLPAPVAIKQKASC